MYCRIETCYLISVTVEYAIESIACDVASVVSIGRRHDKLLPVSEFREIDVIGKGNLTIIVHPSCNSISCIDRLDEVDKLCCIRNLLYRSIRIDICITLLAYSYDHRDTVSVKTSTSGNLDLTCSWSHSSSLVHIVFANLESKDRITASVYCGWSYPIRSLYYPIYIGSKSD